MVITLDGATCVRAVQKMAATFEAQRDHLSALDSMVGDGDHGISIARAFARAARQVELLDSPTPSQVFTTTGNTLQDEMGGVSGIVFGSFFLGASQGARDKTVLSLPDIQAMFREGLAQVQKRGKARAGDKTMVDALVPALQAIEQANQETVSLTEGLKRAAAAAQQGAQATRDMVARVGRAKYLGERSRGYQDAGATSMAFILTSLVETVEQE